MYAVSLLVHLTSKQTRSLSTRCLSASHYELTAFNVAIICLAGVLIHFETPDLGFQTEKQERQGTFNNIVTRTRSHCYNGHATMRSVSVVELHVTVNKMASVA
jgi:hypothetical protein